MSLLDELEGAQMTVVDVERRVIYAWFGGMGVNIYDEDGNEVDYFTIGGATKPTPAKVQAAIDRMIAYERES
jgi:hypothetical protein